MGHPGITRCPTGTPRLIKTTPNLIVHLCIQDFHKYLRWNFATIVDGLAGIMNRPPLWFLKWSFFFQNYLNQNHPMKYSCSSSNNEHYNFPVKNQGRSRILNSKDKYFLKLVIPRTLNFLGRIPFWKCFLL